MHTHAQPRHCRHFLIKRAVESPARASRLPMELRFSSGCARYFSSSSAAAESAIFADTPIRGAILITLLVRHFASKAVLPHAFVFTAAGDFIGHTFVYPGFWLLYRHTPFVPPAAFATHRESDVGYGAR